MANPEDSNKMRGVLTVVTIICLRLSPFLLVIEEISVAGSANFPKKPITTITSARIIGPTTIYVHEN